MLRKSLKIFLPFVMIALFSSCTFITTHVEPLDTETVRKDSAYMFEKPVKAHLTDGSVVIYRNGFIVKNDTIITNGVKYDLTRTDSSFVRNIPAADVAVFEYLKFRWDAGIFFASGTGYFLIFMMIASAIGAGATGG